MSDLTPRPDAHPHDAKPKHDAQAKLDSKAQEAAKTQRHQELALVWLLLTHFARLSGLWPRLARHHFHSDDARHIFDAITQANADGHDVSFNAVRLSLVAAQHPDPDALLTRAVELHAEMPTSWREAPTLAHAVLEAYARRRTQAAMGDVIASLEAPLPLLRARVQDASQEAQRAMQALDPTEGVRSAAEMVDALAQHWRDLDAGRLPPRISSGMRSLDILLGGVAMSDGSVQGGGFGAGQVCAIIGAEKSGKSALAHTLARRMALDQGLHVLIASTELTYQQVAARLAMAEANIPHDALKIPHYMSPKQASALMSTLARIKQAPIHVWDEPFINRDTLISKANAMHAQGKCDVLIIDHLMRMQATPREEEMGTPRAKILRDIVAEASTWARRTGGLVLIPCQASHPPKEEQRMPYAHETAECHTVAWEVDHALAIHRPYAYDPNQDPHLAYIALQVSRVADTGRTSLYWEGPCTDFREPPRDHVFYEPDPPQPKRRKP